jgi:L-cystine transport system substrate-binding protein
VTKRLKTIALFGTTFILLSAALGGCSSEKAATTIAKAEKTIVVGTQNDYPPFAYINDKNELTGYDVEVIKAIDKKLDGYKFEFLDTTWDSIFLSLESNKVQVIADEVAKTKEREEKYLFSNESYFSAQTVIITKKGTTGIRSLKDLEGKKVGAVAGDSYTVLLEEYNKKNGDKIILKYSDVGSPADILQDVQNGRLDAYVNDPIMSKAIIKEHNLALEVINEPIVSDNIALVFNKDKQGEELKGLIDPILKELKKDGTLAELSKKWTEGEYIPQ